MALPVVVPVGEATAEALREQLLAEIETLKVGRLHRSRRPVRPGGHRRAQEAHRGLHPAGRGRRRRAGASTAAASRCRATRTASSSARPCSTTSSRTMKTYQDEIFGPVLQIVRAETLRRGAGAAVEPPVRQRRRHLHPQRPRRARIRRPGQRRHGRHQRADPGAGRLPHLRRLEAHRPSATPTSTAWKACASTPRSRPSPPAGPRAGWRATPASSSRRCASGRRRWTSRSPTTAGASRTPRAPSPRPSSRRTRRAGTRTEIFPVEALTQGRRARASPAIYVTRGRRRLGADAGWTRRSSSRRWPTATSRPRPSCRSTTWPPG